jgi:hypothetical protein
MMLVLGDLFGDMLGGLVGRRFGDRTRRRRRDERARSGRYPAHIRLVAGSEPGLFPWWQAGEVTLAQGVMRFRPRRSSITIAVEVLSFRLRDEIPDDAPAAEVGDGISAVELQCVTATVELIVPARYAADVAHSLQRAS